MDDLMGKIQEVLSDEESMKQLSELAASLFPSSEQNGMGIQWKEYRHMGTTFFEAEANEDKEDDSSKQGIDFDLSKLLMIGQVMSSVSNDKNTELLLALRPLLKEERQEKVDKAVKILKLLAVWSVLKDSGILSDIL